MTGGRRGETEIQKSEYLQNEKSSLDGIKNIYCSFWRAIFWWEIKIWYKIVPTSCNLTFCSSSICLNSSFLFWNFLLSFLFLLFSINICTTSYHSFSILCLMFLCFIFSCSTWKNMLCCVILRHNSLIVVLCLSYNSISGLKWTCMVTWF